MYSIGYTTSIEYFKGTKLLIETNPLFNELSSTIIQRGYLEPEEFVNICIWKTRRQKKRYKNEANLTTIREISKNIIELNSNKFSQDVSKSISLLIKLDVVQVPVASAILTVLFPTKYCIIDFRVRRALFFWDNNFNDCIHFENYKQFSESLDLLSNNPSVNVYEEFLSKIKEKSNEFKCTPRELEMALWAFDEKKGIKD